MPAGKPTAFPGADQATDRMPDDVAARLAEIFGGTTTTAAAKPDTGNPPDSVVSLPDQAIAGAEHANTHAHVPDWFLV
jgi:hypothetical protein